MPDADQSKVFKGKIEEQRGRLRQAISSQVDYQQTVSGEPTDMHAAALNCALLARNKRRSTCVHAYGSIFDILSVLGSWLADTTVSFVMYSVAAMIGSGTDEPASPQVLLYELCSDSPSLVELATQKDASRLDSNYINMASGTITSKRLVESAGYMMCPGLLLSGQSAYRLGKYNTAQMNVSGRMLPWLPGYVSADLARRY